MPGTHWTDEQLLQLENGFSALEKKGLHLTLQTKEIAERITVDGKDHNAKVNKLKRGSKLRPGGYVTVGPPRVEYEDWEKEILREAKRENPRITPREIYRRRLLEKDPRAKKRSRRTKDSITKAWGRLFLSNRKTARVLRDKKRWKPAKGPDDLGEFEEFQAFVIANSDTMPAEEIALRYGLSPSTVRTHQREWECDPEWGDVFQMEFSVRKRSKSQKRASRKVQERAAVDRVFRKMELYDRAEMWFEQGLATVDTSQLCDGCGVLMPRDPDFFPVTEKETKAGWMTYFLHSCVVCYPERHNQQKRIRALTELRRRRRAARARTKKK